MHENLISQTAHAPKLHARDTTLDRTTHVYENGLKNGRTRVSYPDAATRRTERHTTLYCVILRQDQ